jgi:L-histidine N-alpha-methyltransferase
MRGAGVTRIKPSPLAASRRDLFAAEVAEYLRRTPRQLPSKYFYDALGSSLFDAICRLPWYRITRAESALLARHARDILQPMGRPLSLAELGCGNGDKLATLVEQDGEPCRHVHLIDISGAALRSARDRLAGLPIGTILTHQGTYEDGLTRLAALRPGSSARTPARWSADPDEGALMVLFLGSNIGNFDIEPARSFLRMIRRCLTEGDALLLGTDLVKPERDLLLAYDDPLQVTAAFNRNLLRRINDELGGTFELDGFAHRAIWNAADARVEMHLVSRRRQTARVAAADLELTFDPDEWIWTESSYKYEAAGVIAEGVAAGFMPDEQWIDEEARFALTRFTV